MDLPTGSALLDTRETGTPSSSWRVTSFAEERISESPLETLWQRVIAWVLVLTGVVYLGVFGNRAILAEGSILIYVKSFALIGIGYLVLEFLYRRLSNFYYIGPGLKRLLTKVPSDDALPSRIQIYQRGALTGTDEGYTWIDQGTLYFKGMQTVFRVDGRTLVPVTTWPKNDRPVAGAAKYPNVLHFDHGRETLRLKITLIDPFEDFQSRRKAHEFEQKLSAWIYERPVGAMESLLPPTTVHPSLIRKGSARYEGMVGCGAMIALMLFVLATNRYDVFANPVGGLSASFAIVAAGFFLYRSVLLARDLYRDLTVRDQLAQLETQMSS